MLAITDPQVPNGRNQQIKGGKKYLVVHKPYSPTYTVIFEDFWEDENLFKTLKILKELKRIPDGKEIHRLIPNPVKDYGSLYGETSY